MHTDQTTTTMTLPPVSRRLLVPLVLVIVAAVGVTAWLASRTVDEAAGVARPPSTPTSEPPSTVAETTTTTSTTTEPTTTTTTTTSPPTTTTTVAPTTTTVPPPPSYSTGDRGPEVLALQERLVELGFWIPAPDGTYGSVTAQAVMAFQKANGLARDGIAGPQTLAALPGAVPVAPREAGDHVEIDLARQIMLLVRADQTLVFNTSTGRSGWRTPPGRFSIDRQIDGMRHAELGDMWRPKYFNGGIAMHGSNSIPGHAASHGCARLHNAVINLIWDWNLAPLGTPVIVY